MAVSFSDTESLSGKINLNEDELSGNLTGLKENILNGTFENTSEDGLSGSLKSEDNTLNGSFSDEITLNGNMSVRDENVLQGTIGEVYLLSGDGSASKYFTTTSPINNPIGQFKQNEEYTEDDKVTLNDAINKMLHKDVAPTVTFNASGTGVVEIGTTISNPTLYVVVNPGSAIVTNIRFYKGNVLLSEVQYVKNQSTYTYVLEENITDNASVGAQVDYYYKEDEVLKISRTASWTFAGASYHGTVDTDIIENIDISKLIKEVKNTYVLNDTNVNMVNQRYVYFIPVKIGCPTSCKDIGNFEVISSFTKGTFNINGIAYYYLILTDTGSVSKGVFKFS